MGNTISRKEEKETATNVRLRKEFEEAKVEREECWKSLQKANSELDKTEISLYKHLAKHSDLKNHIYELKKELEILKEFLNISIKEEKKEEIGKTRLNIIEHEKLLKKKIEAFDEQKSLHAKFKAAKNFQWDRECDFDFAGTIYSNLQKKIKEF